MRKGVSRLVSVEESFRAEAGEVYGLLSENMSGLGTMGSSPTENWRRYFRSIRGAKDAADIDYRKHGRFSGIKWCRDGRNGWSSGDLSFVMYGITKLKVEP